MRRIIIVTLSLCGIALTGMNAFAEIRVDTSSPFLYPQHSKKISMDFQEANLTDVLKIFSQQTNLNLITAEGLSAKKVTVYFNSVPVEQALEQVLRANNLTYELQPNSNIFIVKQLTKPDVELMTRVYQLKHATVSSAKIKKTLKIAYKVDDENTNTIETEDEAETVGILAAMKGVLTPRGKIVEDPRTNSLTVTDIAGNFSQIELAISKLDAPVPQVLIEVEMLEVSKETADKIGVKPGDTPLTFTGGQRDHVYPWNQNDLLRKGYSFANPEYRVGTINASGLSATLQFLRIQTDTKNLARPRIMTLSNEPAQIKIATKEAIGIKSQTSSSQNLATSSVEAEREETGVFLTVTPQVDVLNGEITMAVVPKVILARTGATFSGNSFKDPEERGSQSILRVPSGDTIVIGGLMRDDSTKTVTKFPILGDIPILGQAFRHTDSSVKERELIIFITPHILDEGLLETAGVNPAALIREQDVPTDQLQAVEKEMSILNHKKL